MSTSRCKLIVKVQPNAGHNEVVGLNDGVWKFKIAAPPVKGKANIELLDFLSDILGVRKGSIIILYGETSRKKILSIEGLNQAKADAALSASLTKEH